MKLPVGIQLYSVRDDFAENMEKTLRNLKKMGYDGVEFAGKCEFDPIAMKALLSEIGLVPIGAHVPVHEMRADAKAAFEPYRTLGCPYVALPHVSAEFFPDAGRFGEIITWAAELGEIANSMGLTLLYHNHDFEFQLMDGKYAMDVMYQTVDASLLQTEIDTCWVKVAGVDPAAYILQYPDRSPVVHLKDFHKDNDEPGRDDSVEIRPVGYGKQDFKAIIDASIKVGAEWLVVEQDSPSMGKTAMECAQMSIDYVKSIL